MSTPTPPESLQFSGPHDAGRSNLFNPSHMGEGLRASPAEMGPARLLAKFSQSRGFWGVQQTGDRTQINPISHPRRLPIPSHPLFPRRPRKAFSVHHPSTTRTFNVIAQDIGRGVVQLVPPLARSPVLHKILVAASSDLFHPRPDPQSAVEQWVKGP